MNLTIFSGTFNPIHIAHLIIAETVKDELHLERILFIPSYVPPHRDKNIADPIHRLRMVQLAIQDNTAFELSDIEHRVQEKSYSYLTVSKLIQDYPSLSGKINFIIGADAFNLIDSWYEIEKLSRLVNFVIVARPDNDDIYKICKTVKLKDFSYQIVNVPQLSISSSYIRNRITMNKSIKYLVPETVEKYIHENNLYIDIK